MVAARWRHHVRARVRRSLGRSTGVVWVRVVMEGWYAARERRIVRTKRLVDATACWSAVGSTLESSISHIFFKNVAEDKGDPTVVKYKLYLSKIMLYDISCTEM